MAFSAVSVIRGPGEIAAMVVEVTKARAGVSGHRDPLGSMGSVYFRYIVT